MFLSENVFIYKRQLNILLLHHFKIVSVSTEKLKTVLAGTLKNIFRKQSPFPCCVMEKNI